MITMSTFGINNPNSFMSPVDPVTPVKKTAPVDMRSGQYQALWQRALVTGALRESLNIPSVQRGDDVRDAHIALKIENILFFDSDSKNKKKNKEQEQKEKKKFKSLAQLLLLTQNNPSCPKARFKICKNPKFKNFQTFEIRLGKKKSDPCLES